MTRTGIADDLITAVVIDDHPFFRDGIARGLTQSGRIKVVAEAADGRAGLDTIREHAPDVAVVDYQMPDLHGIDVVKAVVRDGLPTRVLLLSAISDPSVVFDAVQAGARGYVSKDASRSEIVEAVCRVASGGTVVPADLAAGLVEQIQLRRSDDTPVLTERERQVIGGFARGQSIPAIAAELFIGASTVKTHAQRLYEKLGVSDRGAAVAVAMRRGLLE